MWFPKFLARTFIGLIVAIIVGGGQKAFEAIALAVICTAGLGLLVVIPGAYLIGLICTFWFLPIGSSGGNLEETNQLPRIPATNLRDKAALEQFVELALKRGMGRDAVHSQCIRSGWSSQVVQAAYESVINRKPESAADPS